MDTPTGADDALTRQLDGELRLVHEAILFVAANGSPRVLVAGLHLGTAILGPATRLAAASGVRVVPMWTTDEDGLDIAVEALER